MGLFDVFKGGGSGLSKHVARVANKRAQKHERWESIQVLASDGSDEAIRALLTRFAIRVDPSITDGEEKNAAFLGVVQNGEAALGPVREFLASSDTLAWPMKILRELQSEEEVTTTLLELLSKMDTVQYRVYWLIFRCPDDPSFERRSSEGTTFVRRLKMIEEEMYGMIPRLNTAKDRIPPPEITLIRPRRSPPAPGPPVFRPFSASMDTPGSGTWNPSR